MISWLHITLLIAFPSVIVLLLLLILRRCFHPKTRTNNVVSGSVASPNFHTGLSRLHQLSSKGVNNYHVFQRVFSAAESEKLFNWSDHPSLCSDAVENGWSRFAFRTSTSFPTVKSSNPILVPCGAGGDHGDESGNVEIGCWEVREGSEDYVQKIRLNPGLIEKTIPTVDSLMGAVSVVRTGLPLPGPRFRKSSFPQEAFFEITILVGERDERLGNGGLEGDKIKLIDEVVFGENQDGNSEIIWFSVGLMGKGPLPLRIPGSFPGSVGFNSNGSVYLNGTKLVFESESDRWPPRTEKVIGCGYNPGQKKVFFTVDSQLVHEIHCKTEEFGYPLYPTLAASTDVTVLFNLGQIPFKFAPANSQRTPNPCLIVPGHAAGSPSSGSNIEDGKELFSIRRSDSQWRSDTTRNVSSVRSLEFDQESESDLFEIVLDSTGRSPFNRTC